jgi:hypothetical protein
MRVAIEQGAAEMLFEYRDTLSDRSRSQILRACGTRDRTEFGDADEALQVTNIQFWAFQVDIK